MKLARIMGTSVGMIEAHYGALLDTAHTGLLERLEAFVALAWHAPKPRRVDLARELERTTGLEPATPGLGSQCSTN
jgi:hypothetical protein